MHEFRSRVFGRSTRDDPQLLGTKQSRGASGDAGLHSVAVARQGGRTTDTRGGERHRLSEDGAELTHAGAVHHVQLVNLSVGGAMVEGEGFAPKLWDRVDLHLGDGGTIECAVRWIKGARVGLEFAHETQIDCPPEERYAVLRAAIQRSFPEAAAEAEKARETAALGPEHRGEPRHPLIWAANLHFDFETSRVRLRNISAHGTLIDCQRHLPVGAEPLLDLGDAGSLFGTVSWSRGGQVGLKFHEPFDLARLARSKPEVAPARWLRPAYLDDTAAEGSAWEPHWERLSLGELSQELDGFLKR